MHIINLIDSFSKVNYGVWNAAVSTADVLKEIYDVSSSFYYIPSPNDLVPDEYSNLILQFSGLTDILNKSEITPSDTIFVSHGCWQFPSRVGFKAATKGFKWVLVPQGMLEPWSMQQKRWKKLLYFNLFEKRYIKKASAIRAVSIPEKENLKKLLGREVIHIANGIQALPVDVIKSSLKISFLFMARLHHKKGVVPLIEAWISSSLYNQENTELLIAGPDDGELTKIQQLLAKHADANIRYAGAVYGDDKENLLKKAHFYVLPSFSEGFPTSILEAMQWGAVPLISRGCNFPEIFDHHLGIEIQPAKGDIRQGLEEAIKMNNYQMQKLSLANKAFVNDHYTISAIAKQQYELYSILLKNCIPRPII